MNRRKCFICAKTNKHNLPHYLQNINLQCQFTSSTHACCDDAKTAWARVGGKRVTLITVFLPFWGSKLVVS